MAVTLVCACGKRLRAPGAVPGRVGRCPACGGELRVPDQIPDETPPAAPTPVPAEDDLGGGFGLSMAGPPPTPRPVMPSRAPAGRSRRRKADDIAEDRGLVRPPREPESSAAQSLAYPLWGLYGLTMLVALPPVLWFTTVFSVGLIPTYVLGAGGVTALGAMTMAVPMSFLLLMTLGYFGRFLERVLVDAAAGQLHHPRLPEWSFAGFFHSIFWLLSCLVVGFAVPGFLAVAYWMHCGDLDWADRAILTMILTPGAVYAQVALAAVVLHQDIRAANPVTVLGAIFRVGGEGFAVCLLTAVPTALTAFAVPFLFTLPGLVAAFAVYGFWLVVLYEAMVIARILGNFCRRNRRALGWFPDRDPRDIDAS